MFKFLIKFKAALQNRNVLVDILLLLYQVHGHLLNGLYLLKGIIFGLTAWIGINSIFLQMPLLVDNAPEGWNLPSFVVITVQCGNIGPLVYTLIQKYSNTKLNDVYMIYALLPIGSVAALLMAFFYQNIVLIGDKEYSLIFLILVFFVAVLGCTSSVLFIPYMGRFREIYLVTFLFGEGLSGFLASAVAIIQGSGGDSECRLVNTTFEEKIYEKFTPPPLFGTKEFFIFAFAILCCGTVAFILLDRLKLCKKEYVAVKIKRGNSYEYETEKVTNESRCDVIVHKLTLNERILLMILMAITCAFSNSILQSIESYSTLPYSNHIYHLNVIFRSISIPAACFLAIFLPHTSLRSIWILSILAAILSFYACLTAVLSPNPPLVDSKFGGILIVIVWTISMGLISFIRLSISCVMRAQGGKSLVWIGAATQAGSFIGALLIFYLINYTKIFTAYDQCKSVNIN